MTQDEIKKALECCETDSCCFCPYYKYEGCETILKKDVLALIIEQEKEIERLKEEKKQAQIDVLNKLKTKKYYVWGCGELLHITEDDIDELIKEIENDKYNC